MQKVYVWSLSHNPELTYFSISLIHLSLFYCGQVQIIMLLFTRGIMVSANVSSMKLINKHPLIFHLQYDFHFAKLNLYSY